jgi:hypothetical protein
MKISPTILLERHSRGEKILQKTRASGISHGKKFLAEDYPDVMNSKNETRRWTI